MNIGSVVVLKASTRRMTVIDVAQSLVKCAWFNQMGELREAWFEKEAITDYKVAPVEPVPEDTVNEN